MSKFCLLTITKTELPELQQMKSRAIGYIPAGKSMRFPNFVIENTSNDKIFLEFKKDENSIKSN